MDKIDFDKIIKINENIVKTDILEDAFQYKERLSSSQVEKFFLKNNIVITKSMIKNYLSLEMMPPLIGSRFYDKSHFIFLYIIHNLKKVYSLVEIKTLFQKLSNTENALEIYGAYMNYEKKLEEHRNEFIKNLFNEADSESGEGVQLLLLMDQVVNLKEVSLKLLEDEN